MRSVFPLNIQKSSFSFHKMKGACDLSDLRPLETPLDPMEFLSRLWSSSTLHLYEETLADGIAGDHESGASPCLTTVSHNPFSFASSSTSQLVLDRLMSQEMSPRSSCRLSHSSGPLNGGYLINSPQVSPSDLNNLKYIQAVPGEQRQSGGVKTVGKWLKDRREKKKEEARTHNAQLHAAISLAGVSSAVAAVAVATAREIGRKEHSRTDMAIASAAMLVAAQCVEAAKDMGADHEQLAAVVGSAVSVRNSDDITTLTAAAATALRAAATLKARTLRDIWNIAAVIPVEKGTGMSSHLDNHLDHQNKLNSPATSDGNDSIDTGLHYEENFLGICSQEALARGADLLKRTRKGDLHWKIVSVYISKRGQVILKMKSKHIVGTITKNKKSVVIEVCKEVPEWSGRNLLEGGEQRRYFGLKVTEGRIIEFECTTEREHEIWTEGIAHLLEISRERRSRRTTLNK